ncbi:olfactory receptor 5J3-like [Hyperolius riggenbachi]|uniref:olfactory receptor 5J3-like n=1 Tax=Hyperolius riggenbachi TaxID=752182 RepID=UPI0035A2D095
MDIGNKSGLTTFVFSKLTDEDKLIPFLFIFLMLVYLMTVVGNVGLMVIVHITPKLHTPMYYFLSYLSALDFLSSTAVTPKVLIDLISLERTISFHGCAIQLFVFGALSAAEVPLLSSMSYDRYVAVCHPLHYVNIMTKTKCVFLVSSSFFLGFLMSLAQTICVLSLRYCGSNLIDNFYCDVPFLLQLSCSETLYCSMLTMLLIGCCGLLSLLVILASYTVIIFAIFRIKSSEGRQRAFNTCSSHLTCVTIFYLAVFLTFLRDPSTVMEKQDKAVTIFYSIVAPMLNPLIYSLRNKEISFEDEHIHNAHVRTWTPACAVQMGSTSDEQVVLKAAQGVLRRMFDWFLSEVFTLSLSSKIATETCFTSGSYMAEATQDLCQPAKGHSSAKR